jgi:hypothetical protein
MPRMHRQATPLLVPTNGQGAPEPLRRLQLDTGQYNERWVQELVHHSPSVLPINSIEAAFWPAIPVCMELPLRSGYLDNLLLTPSGNLVVVECKLWRNFEARRKVFAQIVGYAKDLQALRYPGLEEAIRTARNEPTYSLFAAISQTADEDASLEESAFVDAVSRNLRRGRFLLAIVGDGVTENLEDMTEFLQQHAGLHFGLVLVQLAVHALPGGSELIVVPSIPVHTNTIVRGIVEWADPGVRIVAPQTVLDTTPASLTKEQFFAALDHTRPGTSNRLVEFLESYADLQLTWEVKRTLITRMIIGEFKVVPFVVDSEGRLDTAYTPNKELMKGYAQKLAHAIPGAVARETARYWTIQKDGNRVYVWDFLDHQDGARAALEELNRTLREAAGE